MRAQVPLAMKVGAALHTRKSFTFFSLLAQQNTLASSESDANSASAERIQIWKHRKVIEDAHMSLFDSITISHYGVNILVNTVIEVIGFQMEETEGQSSSVQ